MKALKYHLYGMNLIMFMGKNENYVNLKCFRDGARRKSLPIQSWEGSSSVDLYLFQNRTVGKGDGVAVKIDGAVGDNAIG